MASVRYLCRPLFMGYHLRGGQLLRQSTEREYHVESTIKSILEEALKPKHLQVVNESHMHKVPKESETHFKVVVVSELFKGMPLIKRHRSVMDALTDQLSGGVHALSIQAMTPEQWQESELTFESPPCLGGSQR